MYKSFIGLLCVVFGFFILGTLGIIYTASLHHDKASEMYAFAYEEYTEDEKKFTYEFDNIINGFFHKLFMPKSASISPIVFSKDYMVDAGFGDQCASLSYLKLLRDDIDASFYENSQVCCLPAVITDMLPLVFFKKEDRALIMCSMGADAHVISIKAEDFNQLLNSNSHSEFTFDIRDSYK
jgi:hypothetical protein